MNSVNLVKQFPVRLGGKLHNDLERISLNTQISKSVLVRTSIEKLVKEIDKSGVLIDLKNILGSEIE